MTEQEMLYDADMREIIFETFESTGERMRIFEELVIGKSRADAIIVKEDEIIGIEIKSDKDSLVRLKTQVKNYERFCNRCYLACGIHYIDKAEEAVPPYWGILDVTKDEDGILHIEMYREAGHIAKERPMDKLRNQMNLLWRSELINIIRQNKLGGVSDKNKMKLKNMIIEKLGPQQSKSLTLDALIERDYSIYEEKEPD